jgi:hypothetical protein
VLDTAEGKPITANQAEWGHVGHVDAFQDEQGIHTKIRLGSTHLVLHVDTGFKLPDGERVSAAALADLPVPDRASRRMPV